MSIDWITVVAQLANFLLLLWLLRRFLYRPILDGIDAREAQIASSMAAAQDARAKADADQARYQQLYQKVAAQQQQMIDDALASTKEDRDQIMLEARALLEKEQTQWRSQLETERLDFLQRLRMAGALTLSDMTRKVLRDLADQSLEGAIARHLGQRLQTMTDDLKAAAGANQEGRITTHETLSTQTQQALKSELAVILPDLVWQFDIDPEQAPGVILQVGGARVAWTIDSYMDEFDRLLLQSHLANVTAPASDPDHE